MQTEGKAPITERCYLCGGPNLYVVRDRVRHNIPRKVLQCRDCGINYLEPKGEDLSAFYREEYRRQYSPVVGRRVPSRQIFDMYLPFQEARVRRIRDRLRPDMRLLEVGCSAGHFLHAVKPYVAECVGIEYNEEDARFVNQELGIRTYTTAIDETPIPEGYFDVIAAFHVVEHLEDPIAFLATLRRYMKDDGFLYVEVPNLNDALLSVYRVEAYADFWYREPHLFNFTPDTLREVMRRAGFAGEMRTTQRYNFVNHLNWVMRGQPQGDAETGMTHRPAVAGDYADDQELAQDLLDWAEEADRKYRAILNKHMVGDSIVFIGGKA